MLIEFIEKWQEPLNEAIVVKPKFQGKSKQYHNPSQYNASIAQTQMRIKIKLVIIVGKIIMLH
jgi:hypothetical protein